VLTAISTHVEVVKAVPARFALRKVIGGFAVVTMLRLIADHADRNPAAIALLAPGRPSLTYARLCAEIEEHAQILRAIGVGKQDRVALLLPNGPEGALGFLATSTSSVFSPVNPMCMENELATALSHLMPKVLVAWPTLMAKGVPWPRSMD
jgi:oxalate---CoA ligase